MSSIETARALALALPGALERDHHGRASFRVGGAIFATLWDAEDDLRALLADAWEHKGGRVEGA